MGVRLPASVRPDRGGATRDGVSSGPCVHGHCWCARTGADQGVPRNPRRPGDRERRQPSEHCLVPRAGAKRSAAGVEIIAQLINSSGAGKSLIFVPTVKRGRAVQQLLEEHGVSLPFFHAKLLREERDQILGGLTGRLNPPVQAVICTSAFSLGVDIPDIRLVVHWQHPGSVEDYLQEFGRAGRDGHPALALLFSGDLGEAGLWRFMADKTAEAALERGLPREQVERARQQKHEAIAEMAELAVAHGQCFRDALLVALGAASVDARRRLPLRILHRVFEEHPRVEPARACCDACSGGLPESVRAGLFPIPLRSASTSVRTRADHSAATDAPESTVPSRSSRPDQAASAVARGADGAGSSRPVEEGPEEAVLSLVARMPGWSLRLAAEPGMMLASGAGRARSGVDRTERFSCCIIQGSTKCPDGVVATQVS